MLVRRRCHDAAFGRLRLVSVLESTGAFASSPASVCRGSSPVEAASLRVRSLRRRRRGPRRRWSGRRSRSVARTRSATGSPVSSRRRCAEPRSSNDSAQLPTVAALTARPSSASTAMSRRPWSRAMVSASCQRSPSPVAAASIEARTAWACGTGRAIARARSTAMSAWPASIASRPSSHSVPLLACGGGPKLGSRQWGSTTLG